MIISNHSDQYSTSVVTHASIQIHTNILEPVEIGPKCNLSSMLKRIIGWIMIKSSMANVQLTDGLASL